MSRNGHLYLLVFAVGAASLGAEIAVVRLMAPFFGTSTLVWANTIGVVLVALSVGYWLGGRLGDRRPQLRSLCFVVLAAAGLLALVPFVAEPFLDVAVGALDDVQAGAFVGSLLGVLALIAVPVALLGTCSPWAIRLAITDVESAGQVAGRLYALSTAGSLTGTLAAALLLVPFAGTQRTFLILAAAVALAAAAGVGWRWFAAPLLLAGAIALPVGTVKATEEGDVLFEDESPYQFIQVIEQDDGDRVLQLNEGEATHSFLRPGSWLTGQYWDSLLTAPFASLDHDPRRVAILGNAAGTAAREYGHYFPRARIDGVEIDPELAEVGRDYFDMGSSRHLTVHDEDARPWLRQADGPYDVIIVDAYRQPYIPFYLATSEFFELARERLAPGGAVVVNVGHAPGSDELERVLGRTMMAAFDSVLRDPVEDSNTLLVASDGPASAARLERRAEELPPGLDELARIDAARTGPVLPGGEVYTDDLAPVEWLIDRSILGYAADR